MSAKKYLLGVLAALILTTLGSLPVSAAWTGNTYFRGVSANGPLVDWPPCNPDNAYCSQPTWSGEGRYSIPGSVMPNLFSGTTQANGAGAIGTQALGINSGDNSQTRKQKLFDFLKNKNTNGSAWEKMGSALVVHQMLQKPVAAGGWGDTARTIIDPDEWNALRDRLVTNSAITMRREDHSGLDNTAGTLLRTAPRVYDAARYTYSSHADVDAWVFYNGTTKIYALEIMCANPLGSLSGLPPYVPPTPTNYTLTPSGSIDKTVVEPDDLVHVTNTVINSGTNPSDQTIWRLTRMVYSPGVTLGANDKASRDSSSDPCSSFMSSGRSTCETVPGQELTNAVFSPGTRTFDPVFEYNVPTNAPVGTKICFTVSVSRPTRDASPVWRHSTLQCIIVGKKPKLQVWGGDIRSGGKIDTSLSTIASQNTTHGSWAEYAALSVGRNTGFGSGAGLNNGSPNAGQSSWSKLTFANTGNMSGCTFGCYDFTLSSGALASQFVASSSVPNLSGTQNLNSLASGTYRAGDITLSGTTITHGKTIIIVSTGTVTIDGNITYEDMAYTNIRDLPQVIIKAPNIAIRGGVGQVDAWLLAVSNNNRGTVTTCSDVSFDANLTANLCNNRLIMNGPVVADIIYLRRTGGSDSQPAQRGDPAEVFNLRADAYLWANGYGSGRGRAQTVYTKELAPRL